MNDRSNPLCKMACYVGVLDNVLELWGIHLNLQLKELKSTLSHLFESSW